MAVSVTRPASPPGPDISSGQDSSALAQPGTGLRQTLIRAAAHILPETTARILARRYLRASSAFLDDLEQRNDRFDVIQIDPNLALLRHPPDSRATGPLRRVLIVPGHDGHYRQFLRLTRALTRAGTQVDIVVPPGHLQADASLCSLADFVTSLRRISETQPAYDGHIGHCVSSNATIFALAEGMTCPRIVLFSTPVDLPQLVRLGGRQYGIDGACLDRFVANVSALGDPYPLDKAWHDIAATRTESLLMLHTQQDWAAPVADTEALARTWPGARRVVFEQGEHNSILSMRAAIAEATAFLTDSGDVGD